jgi:thiamine pyrophosphokinase
MKRALIIGGGPVNIGQFAQELAQKPDLLIAADYGGFYCEQLGIIPQVLMGDFDSLSAPLVDKLMNAGARVVRYPVQKDETDMELALDLAMVEGSSRIHILGGLGLRLDHTLSNIGLFLKALPQKAEVHLLDEAHDITAIDHRIVLTRRAGWAVSLIPLTVKVSGISTSGLLYPLDNASLYLEKSRGIHNQFTAGTAIVEVAEGVLLVILFKESENRQSVLSYEKV